MVGVPDSGPSSEHAISSSTEFDFDRVLQSMEEDLEPVSGSKRPELPALAPSTASLQPKMPARFIRSAIQEFESGSLDELLIHQLLDFDRDSAEFRKEYVRLRVKSLMRPRSTFDAARPTAKHFSANDSGNSGNSGNLGNPDALPDPLEMESPWRIYRVRDLFSFFGPWLTVIGGIQIYGGRNLGYLLAEQNLLPEVLTPLQAAFLISVAAFGSSLALLARLRGKHYHEFIWTLVAITAPSGVLAIISHTLLHVSRG